jgi:hypothetical protein
MPSRKENAKRKHKPVTGGGLSAFGFGFERPTRSASQQDAVRAVLEELDSRRVLTNWWSEEGEGHVNSSVIWLRDTLTRALHTLDREDVGYKLVRLLRDSCNRFLTAVPDPGRDFTPMRPKALVALKKLRESFRICLDQLAEEYDLPEARDLGNRIAVGTAW